MSSLKKEIYSLIDNIIQQEDELNKCRNTKDNQSILSNISKNKQRIDSLSSFISKESQLAEEKIKILNEEIFGLQNEISNLTRPNTKFTQKDLDQNLIKEKFISKTIKLHENELIQIEENLKLLKEEKISSSNELLNLMSLRENYEELIKIRAKYIFNSSKIKKNTKDKNSIIDNNNLAEIDLNKLKENNSINFDINNINIEYHDLLNIQSINKLCNFIYKIISSNIVATFSSLLIELNLKNVILSHINTAYNKFVKNNFQYSNNKTNSFIRDISVNIVNSDIKISNLFIEPQFEILLKYIFKLFSIEKTINDELKFVNNDYAYNKKTLKTKRENILNKINECNKQKKFIESEKQKVKSDCKIMKNYVDKIQEYKNIIKIKESEIKKIQNELSITKNMYQGQINNLKNTNQNLENKYNNNDLKYTMENINQQIEILFKEIKNKINNINDNDKKDIFINEMIEDINKCLENNGNQNYNNNTYNIKMNEYYSNSSNNNIEINDELNDIINSNINNNNNYDEYDNEENNGEENGNENEELTEQDQLLSSYNSFDDLKQDKNDKINEINENDNYYKKIKTKKNIGQNDRKYKNNVNKNNHRKKFSLEKEKRIIIENKNKKNSLSNKNLNLNHNNYLKLSECFKFNN